MRRISVIDSHTAGEPTRTVIAGGPDLGGGPMAERLARFREHHDDFRSATVNEPRGSDVMVGALLCEPEEPRSATGVIFFNNVGYLGMCGHGTIGVVATLAHLGRIQPGEHRIETPVGPVTAILAESGEVTVVNVPAYRHAAGVRIEVDGYGAMHGDVAWGGNWYFLVEDHGQSIEYSNVGKLTDCAWKIRHALERDGITGEGGKQIDHIELFGPSTQANSRNFVLCPGGAYDRSPCGTGTSAKVACLAASGKLAEGEEWRQESIVGTSFRARYRREGDAIIPSITGTAYINAEVTLLLDPRDPFEMGIRR